MHLKHLTHIFVSSMLVSNLYSAVIAETNLGIISSTVYTTDVGYKYRYDIKNPVSLPVTLSIQADEITLFRGTAPFVFSHTNNVATFVISSTYRDTSSFYLISNLPPQHGTVMFANEVYNLDVPIVPEKMSLFLLGTLLFFRRRNNEVNLSRV